MSEETPVSNGRQSSKYGKALLWPWSVILLPAVVATTYFAMQFYVEPLSVVDTSLNYEPKPAPALLNSSTIVPILATLLLLATMLLISFLRRRNGDKKQALMMLFCFGIAIFVAGGVSFLTNEIWNFFTMIEPQINSTPIPRGYYERKAMVRAFRKEVEEMAVANKAALKKFVPVPDGDLQPGISFHDCQGCPELVVIPPGEFMMGSPDGELQAWLNETPRHKVKIAYSFAVGRFEVTQSEWEAVMGQNFSWRKDPMNPINSVSWLAAKVFTQKLSLKTGKKYRLLSEAEWEYVTRAGTTTAYYVGKVISPSIGNYRFYATKTNKPLNEPAKAGRYNGNRFGLHDLIGNQAEWVADCWHNSYLGAPNNGAAWTGDSCAKRVTRGGSWYSKAADVRSARRIAERANMESRYISFRVSRVLTNSPYPEPKPKATNTQPAKVRTAYHAYLAKLVTKADPDLLTSEMFRDCPQCPLMIVVSTGQFQMGLRKSKYHQPDELPVHPVTIAKAFVVGVFELRQEEWEFYQASKGQRKTSKMQPAVNMSWDDITGYVAWLHKTSGLRYRLLTETEWEYVARAGTDTAYYTGAEVRSNQANFDSRGSRYRPNYGHYRGTVAAVGSYPPNAFGLHDILGNVSEWVQDCWHKNYNGAPSDSSAWTKRGCKKRVIRNGHWKSRHEHLRISNRYALLPNKKSSTIGFRLARDLAK